MRRSHNAVERNSDMAFPRTCYSTSCKSAVRWRIASYCAVTNPDGSPLALFSCDQHEPMLTSRLRSAGTRYQLSPCRLGLDPTLGWVKPTGGLPSPPLEPGKERREATAPIRDRRSWIVRAMTSAAIIVAGVLVAPFIIVYYGIKWFLGWRPH